MLIYVFNPFSGTNLFAAKPLLRDMMIDGLLFGTYGHFFEMKL